MSAIPQQILARQKSALNTLVAAQTAMFTGFEKLVDLNLKVVKATLDEVAQKSQQAVDLKDPQDAAAFSTGLVQPSAEKALAYGKHVYDILNSVQSDLAKLAEAQIAEGQEHINEAVEQLSRNAPNGSESAVALIKSSLATANSAYESLTKAAKQAADVAESNLNAATNATFKAASDAAEVASKAAGRARRA
ncbi:Phasin (PHA-granule associated protein) [Bordetella trematum]|uniref:Granule-associated protein (Phasin) n=1 Tax=Bordetella trematum TaxID=123899 RepID=A0A157KXJ2_9BORD|nr:TIGR01841 family phasin [Bordetella trematum]AUL48172.1 Phasin (PHA-granule associated protein) [Bordetella trematum]AZR95140.1 Phasin (PHA-granule associated protein) [Bordetella trematum]NNH18691.1 TIGR01841 family phasin [Bordetella trematum]QIM70082.1 phasin family protein [Bordetella trematum]SAH89333.1 granule-associated protein (phasin) [Bordetella trematum]